MSSASRLLPHSQSVLLIISFLCRLVKSLQQNIKCVDKLPRRLYNLIMIKSILGQDPVIDESVYIAEGAAVIGNVVIGKNSSVWFNAVVRGDAAKIIIGSRSNVQDNCTLHVDPEMECRIGDDVTIGHNAVVHSAVIGNNVLIGMNATVLNGARIGDNSIVAAGAVVTENAVIPCNTLVAGVPAKPIKTLDDSVAKSITTNAAVYAQAAKTYRNAE